MMLMALAIIGIGAFLLLCKLLWNNQQPSKNTRIILTASLALIVVLGTLVMLARIPPVVALFTMILPYLRVLWRLVRASLVFAMFRQFQGLGRRTFDASATQPNNADSETQTNELAMKLNHQTGTMTGTVLSGEFTGRNLDSLSDDNLSAVYSTLQEEESKRLLEAYVARHRPHLNETSNDTNNQTDGEQMSVKRAADVLGVSVSANKEEIIAVHRRLMDKLHPDKGGSSYLAAELNEAKRVLLKAQS